MPRRSAFTLIELLVVVAIISILMAILLPSLSYARAQSKAVVCASNLRGIGGAFLMYSQEYNGYVDISATGSGPGPLLYSTNRYQKAHSYIGSTPGGKPTWMKLGRLYSLGFLASGKSLYCPGINSEIFMYKSVWHEPAQANQIGGYVPRAESAYRGEQYALSSSAAKYDGLYAKLNSIEKSPDSIAGRFDGKPVVLAYDYTLGPTDSAGTGLAGSRGLEDPLSGHMMSGGKFQFNMVFSDGHLATDRSDYWSRLIAYPLLDNRPNNWDIAF